MNSAGGAPMEEDTMSARCCASAPRTLFTIPRLHAYIRIPTHHLKLSMHRYYRAPLATRGICSMLLFNWVHSCLPLFLSACMCLFGPSACVVYHTECVGLGFRVCGCGGCRLTLWWQLLEILLLQNLSQKLSCCPGETVLGLQLWRVFTSPFVERGIF